MRSMALPQRGAWIGPAVWAIAVLVGCARAEPPLPAACAGSASSLEAGLQRAPAPVRLADTPISTCIGRSNDAAEIEAVGSLLVTVAERIAAEIRSGNRASIVAAGYLAGALERGLDRNDGGLQEAARRVRFALRDVDQRLPAYRRGLAAGRRTG